VSGEGDAALRDRIHEAATTALNSVYGTDDRHAYIGWRIAINVVNGTPLPWNYDFQGEAIRVPSTSEGEGA
jgi:hypothetical protein